MAGRIRDEDVAMICAHFPQVDVITLPDSGHNPHFEARAGFVEAALAYAREHKAPEFIIMDYQLNHSCDGLTLIQTLRGIWQSKVPAALLTAVSDDALKAQCQQHQVSYLSKPIKPAKLKSLLRHG